MLFSIESPDEDLNGEISEQAVKAAVNVVQVACQQTAFIAGKGTLTEEIEKYKTGTNCTFTFSMYMQYFVDIYVVVDVMEEVKDVEGSTAAYCLSLPGKTLFLTHLLSLKKFRKRGNKDGALRAFYKLEEEGLGKLLEVTRSKGSQCVSSCSMQITCTWTCTCLIFNPLSQFSRLGTQVSYSLC